MNNEVSQALAQIERELKKAGQYPSPKLTGGAPRPAEVRAMRATQVENELRFQRRRESWLAERW